MCEYKYLSESNLYLAYIVYVSFLVLVINREAVVLQYMSQIEIC